MTRREQLQERYEDALFALLMDEVATSEGEKLWEENERLKNDPDAEIPEEITKRGIQTIRRHFAKQKARAAGLFTIKAFSKVTMAAGIAAILFTGAFAASETVRVNTLNLIVEVFDESTDFHFSSSSNSDIHHLVAEWVPEGYTLEDQGKDNAGEWLRYTKSEEESIDIWSTIGTGTTLSIDTENAETQNVEIQGYIATLVLKENTTQIVWALPNGSAFISLIGSGVSGEDLIHVANQLNY